MNIGTVAPAQDGDTWNNSSQFKGRCKKRGKKRPALHNSVKGYLFSCLSGSDAMKMKNGLILQFFFYIRHLGKKAVRFLFTSLELSGISYYSLVNREDHVAHLVSCGLQLTPCFF